MKINNGKMIKKLRKNLKISQEDFAQRLHISPRQISRIESGSANMDIWQFISTLELLGQPTEDFWLLYLDSDEYEIYKKSRKIRRLLIYGLFEEAKNILPELEKSKLSKHPFVKQFIDYVKIITNKDMEYEEAINKLFISLRISIPNFDEDKIEEYRMTYNEIYIVIAIANKLDRAGERDRSISLTKKLIESRENSRTSEEDQAILFPLLMTNLSTSLGRKGKIKEALKVCNKALDISREYDNLKYIPHILYNIAHCYKALGEDKQIYKPYLVRAYHCSCAIGNTEEANIIKNDAKKSFGITLR